MEGDFELNKMGWYTVQNVEPNDFLNERLESDQYGIYYNVKFEKDAATHLWQSKTPPQPNEKVYGHIEKTKSGKTTKFRRAKKEDTPTDPGNLVGVVHATNVPHDTQKEDSIARAVALKAAVELTASDERLMKDKVTVLEIADRFLEWLQGGSESTNPKVITGTVQLPKQTSSTQKTVQQPPTSGYDKFKASRPTALNEADEQSLYNSIAQAEELEVPAEFN